jgi:hypothetical protein
MSNVRDWLITRGLDSVYLSVNPYHIATDLYDEITENLIVAEENIRILSESTTLMIDASLLFFEEEESYSQKVFLAKDSPITSSGLRHVCWFDPKNIEMYKALFRRYFGALMKKTKVFQI